MTRSPHYFIALTTYRGWGHADSMPSGFLEEQYIEFVYTQIQKRINKQKVFSYVERKHLILFSTIIQLKMAVGEMVGCENDERYAPANSEPRSIRHRTCASRTRNSSSRKQGGPRDNWGTGVCEDTRSPCWQGPVASLWGCPCRHRT